MTDFAERLRYVRGKLSRKEFSTLVDIHPSTLDRYERGESEPNITVVTDICLRFDVDPNWLVLGKGQAPNISKLVHETRFPQGGSPIVTIRERDGLDIDTVQNLDLLNEIICNLIDEEFLPLDKKFAPALSNMYYHAMKEELVHFAQQLMTLYRNKSA